MHRAVALGLILFAGCIGADESDCAHPAAPGESGWRAMSACGAPTGRLLHSAIWTGEEMIVWGGETFDAEAASLADGAAYDPDTDTWRPIAMGSVDRAFHAATWTGSEMFVWGGQQLDCPTVCGPEIVATATGGRYLLDGDRWVATSVGGAPPPQWGATAVAAGDEVAVIPGPFGAGGGRYDPGTGAWTTFASPLGRPQLVVWTGEQVLLVKQAPDPNTENAATTEVYAFDPVADQRTTLAEYPARDSGLLAAWVGDRVVTFGGDTTDADGFSFIPDENVWRPIARAPARVAMSPSIAVADGRLVAWGGADEVWNPIATGATYDPVADDWEALPDEGAPTARLGATIVWTGTDLIVWGGRDDDVGALATGGIYRP